MTASEKEKIIEAIQQTDDERILFAIKRLLQIEEELPDWHKEIVEQRWNDMKEGKAEAVSWEDVKDKVFRK